MKSEFDIKRAVGGGGYHEESLKYFGGACFDKQRCEDAKRQSLLRFELFRKIDKFLSLNLRNILISPLEGEKKFLSELCELRNFREGYKKYKNKDCGTESAVTVFGANLMILFRGMHRSCICRSALLCRQGKELSALVPQYLSTFSDTVFSRFTSHHSLKRKSAFTLAEVLITLGIIGVVAALTLPSLIANYSKIQTVAQLKKGYSVLEQTIKNAENDYGEVNNWPEWDDAEIILNKYFVPYLQGTKEFGKVKSWDKAICYTPSVKTHVDNLNRIVQYTFLSGMHVSNPFYANKTASIQLNDGTCIGLNPILDLNENASYSALFSRLILIDVNGAQKAPNVVGKDLFFFYINSDGVIKPFGDIWSRDRILSPSFNLSCNTKSILGGHTCAYRIMQEGWKINYY